MMDGSFNLPRIGGADRILTFACVQKYGTPILHNNVQGQVASVTPVPEAGTMILLGTGLIGLAGYGRKRFRK